MNCLLRAPKAFTLGMHALALLAHHSPTRLSVGAIADFCGVSEAHLAKVIQTLARHGIVSAARGPAGGITLNEPADNVSLLDLWNVLEGPATDAGCAFAIPACTSGLCPVGRRFAAFHRQMRRYLEKTTLQDLKCMSKSVRTSRKTALSATETIDV